jgi:hypothetical protein
MSTLIKRENIYNTPHIAPKEREDVPLQVGHDEQKPYGVFDLWRNPGAFRSFGTTEKHSLDTLA